MSTSAITTTLLLTPESPIVSSRASATTFGHPASTPPSPSSYTGGASLNQSNSGSAATITVPILNVNGEAPPPSVSSAPAKSSPNGHIKEPDDTAWGSNFWVTLVDPQTQASFFACPATGQVNWDPPMGSFVLPPSEDGEWWELSDESRGGIPYYYHTKTQDTVWERPEGFVIPLGIIQNTALGRRLSQTTFKRFSQILAAESSSPASLEPSPQPSARRARAQTYEGDSSLQQRPREPPAGRMRTTSARTSPAKSHVNGRQPQPSPSGTKRSTSSGPHFLGRVNLNGLPPIPASPYGTDASTPPSPTLGEPARSSPKPSEMIEKETHMNGDVGTSYPAERPRPRSPSAANRMQSPQSLIAAVELFSNAPHFEKRAVSDDGHDLVPNQLPRYSFEVPMEKGTGRPSPRSPKHPALAKENQQVRPKISSPLVVGKDISAPTLNYEATMQMSPMKHRFANKPIPVEYRPQRVATLASIDTNKSTRSYPVLPHDLASDIQQFVESDYAKRYFSTHRTGFIFRRRVPVSQMMTWQKSPLSSPLLTLNRAVSKEAVKVFKVIQRIMGDRERERPTGTVLRKQDSPLTGGPVQNASTVSLASSSSSLLEEERWLLGEGLTHGELRDEIYCQVMKQLNGNPSPESIFRGWQLLCVLLISFPPSKNFETYLHSFMQQRTTQVEGRVDVMAKYCIRRLGFISKKGPRGKPPSLAEIETAADAAFNPSTFGESLDATIRLQERNYPHQKVPIILPFLADGILALGGTKAEGIFRVPGDGDAVSDLKLRIDRGYYTLDGVDDPHVLASLLKLWLRELCDPLIPEETYNDCISAREPAECVQIVGRLPTINRRVVLFVVSFLQLFLEERVQNATKMTPANLALVMTPNLLRCNSDSMAVVFTNAQYEQKFVYNLLMHLNPNEVDKDYVPAHGLGAVSTGPMPRTSKSRRRPNY